MARTTPSPAPVAAVAPYGTWGSPVTLEALVRGAVGLAYPQETPEHVYWSEARPSEGGRSVIVRAPRAGDSAPEDVFGPAHNARTTVHEYGGLCYAVRGGTVYFSNFADQRVYRVAPGSDPEPVPISPAPPVPRSVRFAAPVLTPDGKYLFCVRETHPDPDEPAAVVNDVVVISTDGADAGTGDGAPRVVVQGHDFFSHLVLSPDGRRLAWTCWDHPNMPWDGTELWEADLESEVRISGAHRVAGGTHESVTQPKYTPAGELLFVSDRTGWWNLYAAGHDGAPDRALAPMDSDLGGPDWQFGASSYAPLADGSILATWWEGGLSRLGILRPGTQAFTPIGTEWAYFEALRPGGDGRSVTAVAGSASAPLAVVRIAPDKDARGPEDAAITVLEHSHPAIGDAGYLSLPEPFEFPTDHGRSAHALYYPPKNPGFEAPEGERPPLIVSSHGGPTAAARPLLDYGVQFWTTRGFAVVAVNYGGSTGYGREYRERLRGAWGVVDVADCVNAARALVAAGRADGNRLLIHGGSAGGYTTLCAATWTEVFAAGASYFGVADVTVFAEETHKFESRYTDALLGPWPATAHVWRDRSPISHADQLRTPLIIFQGLEDKIVPPKQAEVMVTALRDNGVPHAYIAYEGEQHGFRKAENVMRTAEAELYFYGRVLGFEPADELRPVEIVREDRLAT